jgi:hypothetical protein
MIALTVLGRVGDMGMMKVSRLESIEPLSGKFTTGRGVPELGRVAVFGGLEAVASISVLSTGELLII